jgi:PAS domain S-box-containing protein
MINSGVPPFTEEDALEHLRAAAGGKQRVFEWHARRKDGVLFWVEVSMRKAQIAEKKVVLVTLRDITERKEAEKQLRQSDLLQRALIDNFPYLAWMKDGSSRYLASNTSFANARGLSVPDALVGRTDFDIFPADLAERYVADDREVLESGHPFFTEEPFDENGRRIWLETYKAPISLDGRMLGTVGFARDITERRKMEERLRERESRYRLLFEQSSEGIFIADVDGICLDVNEKGCEILGVSGVQVIVRPIHGFVAAESKSRYRLLFDRAMNGETVCDELVIIKADGGHVPVEVKMKMYYADGRYYIQMFFHDVSERRHAEEERRRLEDQLRQAQKMEAVGQLAGGIAHDFNNILTAIIGFAHVIEMKLENDSPLQAYVNHISCSAERAANLTGDLLTFSRKRIMPLEPIELNEALGKAQKLLKRLIREDIEFTVISSEYPLAVMANDTQLTQIFLNLTTNARDSMPDGGRIHIALTSFSMDQDYVDRHGYGSPGMYALITFSDTGCGMDERTRERIFEPFFTTKEVSKGTGLGLATVFGIVEQLNGHINVYSEPGKGTVFRIYLPEIRADALVGEKERTVAPAPGGAETILFAEDNPTIRELMASILTGAGYTVIVAQDGVEAAEVFQRRADDIDVMLLDAIMPGKNGIEVLKLAMKLRPSVRAILMSGYTPEVMAMNDLIGRGVKFLQKPIHPRLLRSTLRELLDRQGSFSLEPERRHPGN